MDNVSWKREEEADVSFSFFLVVKFANQTGHFWIMWTITVQRNFGFVKKRWTQNDNERNFAVQQRELPLKRKSWPKIVVNVTFPCHQRKLIGSCPRYVGSILRKRNLPTHVRVRKCPAKKTPNLLSLLQRRRRLHLPQKNWPLQGIFLWTLFAAIFIYLLRSGGRRTVPKLLAPPILKIKVWPIAIHGWHFGVAYSRSVFFAPPPPAISHSADYVCEGLPRIRKQKSRGPFQVRTERVTSEMAVERTDKTAGASLFSNLRSSVGIKFLQGLTGVIKHK